MDILQNVHVRVLGGFEGGVEVLESGDARMKLGIAARCVLSPRDQP